MTSQAHNTGSGTRQTTLDRQRAVSAATPPKWQHPWQTTPRFLAKTGEWIATVEPGFVNGRAPAYRTTVVEQQAAQLDFGINPLTGKPFFSDSVFAQPQAPGTTVTAIDIPLYLRPAIALPFRNLGYDSGGVAGGNAVPQFFLERGAALALTLDSTNVDASAQALVTPPPTGLRLLRACDVILHQPRLALTSQISVGSGLADGSSIVTQTLGVNSPAAGDVLQLFGGTFDPTNLTAGIDPTKSGFTEPAFDEIVISTVYLLSPPNTPLFSAPDGSWTPYVQHNLFWNLHYTQPILRLLDGDPSVHGIPPLAGGAAQLIINFLTASINDIVQQTVNLITAHSLQGTFWTPTGGGHDAAFPPVVQEPAQGSTGLDKAGRIAAQTAQAATAKRAAKLDPDFPFRTLPFDFSLLS